MSLSINFQIHFQIQKNLGCQVRLEELLYLFFQILLKVQEGKVIRNLFNFFIISLGSLSELETQYIIAIRLEYLKKSEDVEVLINDVKRLLLLGFRNYLKANSTSK